MVDLSLEIGRMRLKNPVMPASGTFSEQLGQVFDLNRLGALVTKSVTPEHRDGNPVPRVCETPSGMLNSIGIPSKGLQHFVEQIVPLYSGIDTPLVASLSAPTVDAFAAAAATVSVPGVAAIEANISCPNLEANGHAFAMAPDTTEAVLRAMTAATDRPIWAKLTPNTGDIVAIARAAEAGGAEAVVVANTFLAMAIDIATRRPKLGNVLGGLSGPAIKPIVLRMVHQCSSHIGIPVIGCGGIMTADDVIEYLLAGATAVQVGTATFLHPSAMTKMVETLSAYARTHDVDRLQDLRGAVVLPDDMAMLALAAE